MVTEFEYNLFALGSVRTLEWYIARRIAFKITRKPRRPTSHSAWTAGVSKVFFYSRGHSAAHNIILKALNWAKHVYNF